MKRILFLLLLGILCIAVARALTDSTPTDDSAAGKQPLSSNDLAPIATSGSSSETRSPADSRTSNTATGLPPKPPSDSLNIPGEDFDFSSYLKNGRTSIVYFYAEWCPACRELSPAMATMNRDDPNIQILFLNIGEWNSPIADRYGVTFVPYLQVYDQHGSLIAEGRAANGWLQEFRRRQIRN